MQRQDATLVHHVATGLFQEGVAPCDNGLIESCFFSIAGLLRGRTFSRGGSHVADGPGVAHYLLDCVMRLYGVKMQQ